MRPSLPLRRAQPQRWRCRGDMFAGNADISTGVRDAYVTAESLRVRDTIAPGRISPGEGMVLANKRLSAFRARRRNMRQVPFRFVLPDLPRRQARINSRRTLYPILKLLRSVCRHRSSSTAIGVRLWSDGSLTQGDPQPHQCRSLQTCAWVRSASGLSKTYRRWAPTRYLCESSRPMNLSRFTCLISTLYGMPSRNAKARSVCRTWKRLEYNQRR